MSDALFQKEIRIRKVSTLDSASAQGLADPTRIRMLDMLGRKPMTAEEIAKALDGSGHKKATTTVRHHLEMLKQAGLVETARMVEVRGAVMKYYSATIKVYDCEASKDLEKKTDKLIDDVGNKLLKILKGIHGDKRFAPLVGKNDKCTAFLAAEILNSALARAVESKEYREILAKNPQK